MQAEIAWVLVAMLLLISQGVEGKRKEGGKKEMKHSEHNCTVCEDIKVSLPAGFTGQITCPPTHTVNITRVMCKAPCASGENKVKTCTPPTIESTIKTACDGKPTCAVTGMTGSCLDSKDVVYVMWNCN